jgi:hypothetical protein
MSDIALANTAAYAARYHLRLAERLGFGIHGTVHVAEHQGKQDQSAIKAFNSAEFYHRERAVYDRLRDARLTEILGFHVPQLIRADDDLQAIEMTIVTRPFVLDFAGAYLDARPEFSEEIWAEWESQKREQFGERWRIVQAVMNAFEEMDIYLVDVSPSNIAFAD